MCAAAPVRRKGHTLVEDVSPRCGRNLEGPRTEATETARSDSLRETKHGMAPLWASAL